MMRQRQNIEHREDADHDIHTEPSPLTAPTLTKGPVCASFLSSWLMSSTCHCCCGQVGGPVGLSHVTIHSHRHSLVPYHCSELRLNILLTYSTHTSTYLFSFLFYHCLHHCLHFQQEHNAGKMARAKCGQSEKLCKLNKCHVANTEQVHHSSGPACGLGRQGVADWRNACVTYFKKCAVGICVPPSNLGVQCDLATPQRRG